MNVIPDPPAPDEPPVLSPQEREALQQAADAIEHLRDYAATWEARRQARQAELAQRIEALRHVLEPPRVDLGPQLRAALRAAALAQLQQAQQALARLDAPESRRRGASRLEERTEFEVTVEAFRAERLQGLSFPEIADLHGGEHAGWTASRVAAWYNRALQLGRFS
jgi:hypothetical protein